MKKVSFDDVFRNLKMSANVKSILKNTYISDMSFNVNTRTMSLQILSDEFFDESCLDDFKSDICDNFELIDNVNILVNYPMENISDEEKIAAYLPKIIEIVSRTDTISANILSNSDWEVYDSNIIFYLDHNGSYLLKYEGVDNLIRQTLKYRLNIDYAVRFENKPLSDETPDFSAFDVVFDDFTEDKEREEENKDIENKVSKPETKSKPIISDKKLKKTNNSGRKISLDPITNKSTPINDAYSLDGNVVVEGEVFIEAEIKEIKGDRYIVKSAIKDKKSAVIIKLFCDSNDYKENYKSYFKEKTYIKVQGNISEDKFENGEKTILISAINKAKAPEGKMDDAPEKRVELHLHTNMSMMDAVTSATTYIKRAEKWGHKAIAITDHGVVQAYPEAMKASKGTNVKVLYGCEGYLVNDMGAVVKNSKAQSLDETYVVFDIETTGLQKEVDKIIEIGAVKVKNGEIIDRYSTFVNPHMEISEKITKLTGIDDTMVKDYPDEDVIVPDFLEFIGDSVLVAHNAAFDVSFIRQWGVNNNKIIDNTVVDT
ncbi:MAG: exonuclease domain-containing protein, partial [Lachnospirales bacterium]